MISYGQRHYRIGHGHHGGRLDVEQMTLMLASASFSSASGSRGNTNPHTYPLGTKQRIKECISAEGGRGIGNSLRRGDGRRFGSDNGGPGQVTAGMGTSAKTENSIEIEPKVRQSIKERFAHTHKKDFKSALAEIMGGRKKGHWSWYIFPTPVWPGASDTNRYYSLKTDMEAFAFLQYKDDDVDLRENYMAIMSAVGDQVESGVSLLSLVGHLDEPKVLSSAKYFKHVATRLGDRELKKVVTRLLKLIK